MYTARARWGSTVSTSSRRRICTVPSRSTSVTPTPGPGRRGDRSPVRSVRRLSQPRGDLLLALLGEHVLQPLRLFVHAVETDPEGLREIQLEQAVVADDLQGHLLAEIGRA